MICSVLVGRVGPAQGCTEKDGEKFFNRDVIINEVKYPALISEYVIPEDVGPETGKFALTAYIRAPLMAKDFDPYLVVVDAEVASPDTAETNIITISGFVRFVNEMRVSAKTGEVSITLGINYRIAKGDRSTLKCIGHEQIARKYRSELVRNDIIEIVGPLSFQRGRLCVEIDKLNYVKKGVRK